MKLRGVGIACALLGLTLACSSATAPEAGLTLQVTRDSTSADRSLVWYTFVVANGSTAEIQVLGCGGGRPDVEVWVGGRRTDGVSALCSGPAFGTGVRLAVGARLGGVGSVPRLAGAEYRPLVRVSAGDGEPLRARILAGPSFFAEP